MVFLRLCEFLCSCSNDEDGDIDCVADAIDGFAVNKVGHFVVAVGAEDEEVEVVFFYAFNDFIDRAAEA